MNVLGEQMSVSTPLKDLLLEIGRLQSLDEVLHVVVNRLADQEQIAMARIWLLRPGDICSTCFVRKDCPDQSRCLHLVASAGTSQLEDGPSWTKIDGHFRRFPLGVRKVGIIGATGECVSVMDIAKNNSWIADLEWTRQEGIRGFSGQPLIFNGEILGVIAIFTRTTLSQPCLDWLRMIADLSAASIANKRSYEEITRLRAQLELENEYLREEVSESRAYGDIIGQSPALRNIIQQIDMVAPTDANVLILGESGTGKELVAQEIHRRSSRSAKAMVRVNCASVPRELFESEFFGHVKGAFTGAIRDRAGRFEIASGGTLFLDEVGEIPVELQSKLLRVLQEGTYERIGEDKTREVDVRIVASTNRDLRKDVEAGRFRQDLYYRLNIFPIEVPPLRKRQEDIPILAEHFLQIASKKFNRQYKALTQANIMKLQYYDWPGNVRELQNIIERAMITSNKGILHINLPSTRGAKSKVTVPSNVSSVVPDEEMKRREQENILTALQLANWRVHGPDGAAVLLGIRPTTLASRIKKMGLSKPE